MINKIYFLYSILLINILSTISFRLLQHPLEKRIGYIYNIKNIKTINNKTMNHLQEIFKTHPLLIFKELDTVSPIDFLNFVKCLIQH